MEKMNVIYSVIGKLYLIVIAIVLMQCGSAASKQAVKCNVSSSSEVDIKCENDNKISIQSIRQYTMEDGVCTKPGNCSMTLQKDNAGYECNGTYGKCSMPLIFSERCDGAVAVEVNFTCQNSSGESKVEKYCSRPNTFWSADITCPNNYSIHINSVSYWKISENMTCQESRSSCFTTPDPGDLYEYCEGKQECRTPLPTNITTLEGCQYNFPYIGADISYACLNTQDFFDMCSESVRNVNDSLTTLYLTSNEYVNLVNRSDKFFCGCRINSQKMMVKILYLNLTKQHSEQGELTFSRPTDINVSTIITDTIIYTDITDLIITFNHKNLTGQSILLEFNAIEGILQLDCSTPVAIPSTLKPISSTASPSPSTQAYSDTSLLVNTDAPSTTTDDGKSDPRGLVENDKANEVNAIIGAVLGTIIFIVIIIVVCIIVLRKTNRNTKSADDSETAGIDNPAFRDKGYTILEANVDNGPYSIKTDPQLQTSISLDRPAPQYINITPVDNTESDETEQKDTESLSNDEVDLEIPNSSTIGERFTFSPDPNYADIHDFNDSAEAHQSTDIIMRLDAPKTENVEYARVKKIKKTAPSMDMQFGSMYDNSFDNIDPPDVPNRSLSDIDEEAMLF